MKEKHYQNEGRDRIRNFLIFFTENYINFNCFRKIIFFEPKKRFSCISNEIEENLEATHQFFIQNLLRP